MDTIVVISRAHADTAFRLAKETPQQRISRFTCSSRAGVPIT